MAVRLRIEALSDHRGRLSLADLREFFSEVADKTDGDDDDTFVLFENNKLVYDF